VVTEPPDWRTELLMLVTNPNVAFVRLLIGVYGLIFEFLNPGAVAPGLRHQSSRRVLRAGL
jgi:membrane-bound serine protease (ClpP class)